MLVVGPSDCNGGFGRGQRRVPAWVNVGLPGTPATNRSWPEGGGPRSRAPDGRSASAVAYRSDLLRIKSVSVEDGGARVELERHTIGPAQNQFYIARFGELARWDRIPDVHELGALPGAASVVWTEIHHWRLDDGPWLRATPTFHFVAQ